MLRYLVLVLALINLAFYAWSHGWLKDTLGLAPAQQTESNRLSQQIHPEKLIVISNSSSAPAAPAVATAASSAVAEPTQCLEAGPFDSAEGAQTIESLKAVLPANSWVTETVAVSGEYMIYMGPFADPAAVDRKLAELKRLRNLAIERIQTPPALANGLSLGKFNRQDDAVIALDSLRARGVRSARVVTARPPMDLQVVRVAQATSAMQTALTGIKTPEGKGFIACHPPAASDPAASR